MDWELLAAELIRALRGRTSQVQLSRRLGYGSNIVQRWETQRCWPNAEMLFVLYERSGQSIEQALGPFLTPPTDAPRSREASPAQKVTALLQQLRHREKLRDISAETGLSRFALSRWFAGKAQPKVPEFLHLVAMLSERILDFLSLLVDPSQLPSVSTDWSELEAARRSAYETPWAHAVLRVMEIAEFAQQKDQISWLAGRLALSHREVSDAVELLVRAGQVEQTQHGYRARATQMVDTRLQSHTDPERSRQLKSYWLSEAQRLLNQARPGVYAYNLMSIAAKDEARLLELHMRYFHEMQALVAKSAPAEKVVLFSAQLIPLT